MRALSPCFVFRPDTLARACWRKVRARPERCVIKTAWGDLLEVQPQTFIGAHLYLRGVHELAVCELLWRLCAPGEQAVDVGANIGAMTSVLSKRVGMDGRVFAFEPHPRLYFELTQNVRRWHRPNTDVFERAASCTTGIATLWEDVGFKGNNGLARLGETQNAGASFEVRTVRLDEALPVRSYGLAKIDVEGHEGEVLAGAEKLLAAGRVRDVVFESIGGFAGPAHHLLRADGYQIFQIKTGFTGPKLQPIPRHSQENGGSADYLATLDPRRAQSLIGPAGWKVLHR